MERYEMLINEAMRIKQKRTKSIIKLVMVLAIIVSGFFVIDFLSHIKEHVNSIILAGATWVLYVFLYFYFKASDKILVDLFASLKDKKEIMFALKKYNKSYIKFEGSIHYNFLLKKAYESLESEQGQYRRIKINPLVLDLDSLKTEEFYQNIETVIELENIPNNMMKIFKQLSIDMIRPYKIQDFDDSVEYIYPVAGQMVNDSTFIKDRNPFPVVTSKKISLSIMDSYYDFEQAMFLVILTINRQRKEG